MSRQPPRPDSGLYQDWKAWANALLRYLQLVDEESALSPGTQLKTYASTDVPSADQEGQLIYQTDLTKVSASFNSVWNDFAFLSVNATWTGQQTFYVDAAFEAAIILKSDDVSANSSPLLLMTREPLDGVASVNDVGAGVLWRGMNAAGELVDYGFNFLGLLSVTDGAETGHLVWNMMNNGVITNNFSIGNGVRIGVPTGNYLGVGKLNTAGEYYINGSQVVKGRITGWTVDTGTAKRTANTTYSGTAEVAYTQATIQTLMDTVRDLSQTIKALKDDLHATAGHGLIGT